MLTIALTIPLVLFLVLGRITRTSWRLELALLVLSPVFATLILTTGAGLFTNVGPIPSVKDWISFIAFSSSVLLIEGIYPSGACIAALILFAWFVFEKPSRFRPQGRMLWLLAASAIGSAIGLSFAGVVLLAYRNPQFVEFMQHRDRPPVLVLPLSILSGAIDGALVAYFLPRHGSGNAEALARSVDAPPLIP